MQQGFFSVQQTCPDCRGTGKMIKDPCRDCHGEGRVQEYKTLNVKIPSGVDTGDRIRLGGEGEAGVNGGPAGDLYVQVSGLPITPFSSATENICTAKCRLLLLTLPSAVSWKFRLWKVVLS